MEKATKDASGTFTYISAMHDRSVAYCCSKCVYQWEIAYEKVKPMAASSKRDSYGNVVVLFSMKAEGCPEI